MKKALIALGAFAGAISLSIFAFARLGHAPVFSTIESPDKTYVLQLRGKKSRPRMPIVEHSVYLDLYSHGKPVVRGQKLHSGDWFDPGFENLYDAYTWEDNSTLVFHRRNRGGGGYDTLIVTNNTSKSIKFLQIQSDDLFLLLDLRPQARVGLIAPPQTWLSWITAEGEFEDGKSVPRKGMNFKIDHRTGPFTYEVAINDDGLSISSPQLPELWP